MQRLSNESYASGYAGRNLAGTDSLPFQLLQSLIPKLVDLGPALDLGCGAGRSSRFLKSLGFDAIGLDTNDSILRVAHALDSSGSYHLLRSEKLPFQNGQFNLVFSSWMVLELPSRQKLAQVCEEAFRVLNDRGVFIVVTNTEEFYRGRWVSSNVDFDENRGPLRSGQPVRTGLINEGIIVTDFYWSDRDYKDAFRAAGFMIEREERPLAPVESPVRWMDETKMPPHVVYLLRKLKMPMI